MAIRYAYDLYPRTDPRDGAAIRRFEHLQEASYRSEENGTGSGQIVVAGDSADGEDIDPRGLQYVRVLEIDDSDVETVKGGFWLEMGKFQALTRKETKHLEFGGAGTLAYLQREVMWSRSYINEQIPSFIGQDPIGTTWDLSAQSTVFANGNYLGAMLWRAITEAQLFPTGSYTHRHFDGVDHTGTHPGDDKPESAIPDLVMTFDQNDDSDGNPWTLTAGTFTAQVGESLLSVTRRLMEMGLKVEMDPDTFELNAWEAPHRTDRTSTSWASGKVLFTAPTAEAIDTGNILSDTIRTVRPYIQRTAVLAGSDNVYAVDSGAGDVPWHGGYRIDTEDTTTAEDVASRQRLARSDAVDHLKVVMKLGNAPLSGRYRPWVHVNPGDLVTVDTGSDQWEFDNITFPVAALTIELKQGGDWRAIAELGSSFTSLLEPAFQVGGQPSHTHPPNPMLCQPPLPGSDESFRWYFSNGTSTLNSTPPADQSGWDNMGDTSIKSLTRTPAGNYGSTGGPVSSAGDTGGGSPVDVRLGRWAIELNADEAAVIAAGGAVLASYVRAKSRNGIGISEAAQDNISQQCVYVTQGASATVRGVALATHTLTTSAGCNIWPASSTLQNRVIPAAAASDVLSAVSGTVAGDYLVLDAGYRSFTDDTTGGRMYLTNDAATDLPTTEGTTAIQNAWVELAVAGIGATTGDLPLDTVHQDLESVGSASRAARCDHQHAHGLLSADGTNYHDFSTVVLSDDTPLEESGDGDPGTDDFASRADHVHPAAGGGEAGTTEYFSRRLVASQTNAAVTIDVNSTAYVAFFALTFYHDWDKFPATHFMITAAGQSNAAGQTITMQLAPFADPTNPVSAGGDDLVITNTVGLFGSGWIAVSDAMSGIDQLGVYLKGSNSTVDLSMRFIDIAFKID